MRYYSIDHHGQFETHDSLEKARENATASLSECADMAAGDDGWPEGTDWIEYGRLVPLSELRCEEIKDPESIADAAARGLEGVFDYTLHEVTPQEVA